MATRIENILARARDTLADPDKDRWSDDRLLRLLDEGQQDIAKHSQILKGLYEFSLVANQYTYELPEDLWLITRASFNSVEIPLLSYDNMDDQANKEVVTDRRSSTRERVRGYSNAYGSYYRSRWELDTSNEVSALIYDNRDMSEIRVYPIPNEDIAQTQYTFSTTNPTPDFVGEELLGVVVELEDYTFTSPYGVLSNLFDPFIQAEIFDSPYGVVTGMAESEAIINIWYVRLPKVISELTDELEIHHMFDTALKHYVVGHALRDDIQEQYRQMGAESLQLYERELELAKKTNKTDGTRAASTYRTGYRSAFE